MLDLLYIGFFLLISPSACDCPDFKTQDVKVLIAHFLGLLMFTLLLHDKKQFQAWLVVFHHAKLKINANEAMTTIVRWASVFQ
jgi:hypothetical protein